jgi:hypothetical protein
MEEKIQQEYEAMAEERDLGKIDDQAEAAATLLEWEAKEHQHRPKTIWWYVALVGVGVVLSVVFWLLSNFLAIGVIVVAVALLIYVSYRPSVSRRYRLMVHGIAIDDMLYHYRDLKAFNFLYEPGEVTILLVKGNKLLNSLLALELGAVDPAAVRDVIAEYLPEDPEITEPLPDVLARRLGF